MLVLGLNTFHADSSAALFRDGTLVAAAEEERFRRIKHWAGFPSEAIRYCLSEARCRLGDVDVVATNQDTGANLLRKAAYVLAHRPSLSLVLDRIRNRRVRVGLHADFAGAFPDDVLRAEVRSVEHHLAHLASAFLASPFDEAVTVSVDGFGDFASAAWGVGRGATVDVEGKVFFPHSLGIFYEALTQYLGFPGYGDEYKVMGLAPYGTPTYLGQMRRIVRLQGDGSYHLALDFFRHHREHFSYQWRDGAPVVGTLWTPLLEELLGPARRPGSELTDRHRDIACSAQAMYEEAFFHLLNHLHGRHGLSALALAGGCAMNSVANGKVYRHTAFRRLYVPPAAGDAGGAIGAALVAWRALAGRDRASPSVSAPAATARFAMTHAQWGPHFAPESLRAALDARHDDLRRAACDVREIATDEALCRMTAQAIADGKVVGWFEGRMEWGPRALGNRSILCDPRRADMQRTLNLVIKRRESFRPFAPSILREAVPEWFEDDDDVPFMSQVYSIRAEKRSLVPAVTHVDGTGRLQTVSFETNPLYHHLIETFAEITGVPMVLNTSFNENEPIVCRPEEALDCFLRTRMDVLVLGNRYLSR